MRSWMGWVMCEASEITIISKSQEQARRMDFFGTFALARKVSSMGCASILGSQIPHPRCENTRRYPDGKLTPSRVNFAFGGCSESSEDC